MFTKSMRTWIMKFSTIKVYLKEKSGKVIMNYGRISIFGTNFTSNINYILIKMRK